MGAWQLLCAIQRSAGDKAPAPSLFRRGAFAVVPSPRYSLRPYIRHETSEIATIARQEAKT
jgi:hypothetical protein